MEDAKRPSQEDLMRLGIKTAKEGNKTNARMIFQQVLNNDKRHVSAWLWMAALEDDKMEKRRHLETVLGINPNNETAKKQLALLDQAVRSSEGHSMRLGIFIVLVLVLVAIVAVAVIIVAATAR